MRTCKTQTGGVKLKNPTNAGFTPVLNMLNHPESKMEMLSYESLFGFLFELIVDKSATEYLGLSKSQKTFSVPITNFILKIVVIGKDGDGGITSRYLPNFFGTQKECELSDSFINESKMQQDIWLGSITGGHPELCPSVANFSLFDNENSQKLLNYLYKREPNPTITQRIISFLYELTGINAQYSIGIILMPKVMNSITMQYFGYTTVHDVSLLPKEKNSKMYQAYSNVIAQIARLYILTGIVHVDLHPGNILIQKVNSRVKSQLIDFGRVVHVPDNPDNPNNRKALFDELFPLKTQRTKRPADSTFNEGMDKEKYMKKLLSIIYPDPSRGKIRWLFNAINSLIKNDQTTILTDAFGTLLSNIVNVDATQSILPKTIEGYLRDGYLFDTKQDISQYYFSMPDNMPQLSASTIEVPNIREQQLFLTDSDECHLPSAQKMQHDSSTVLNPDSATEPDSQSSPYDESGSSGTVADASGSSRRADIDDIDGIDDDIEKKNQFVGKAKYDDLILSDLGGKPKTKRSKRRTNKSKKKKTRKNNLKKSKTRKNNIRR